MRSVLCVLALLTTASFATAQNFSGSWHCDKPSETHSIAVQGEPHHIFTVEQGECTATGGNQVAGETLKTDSDTAVNETTPTFSMTRGFEVITSDTGDKLYVRAQSHGRIKDGTPENVRGTWRAVGGSGKLRGVRMHGTYTVSVNSDGSADVQVTGTTTALHR